MLKNNINKSIIFSFFIALTFVFSSCAEEDNITNPKENGFMPAGADFYISSSTWDEYWHYSSDTLTNHINTFKAVFSDGKQLVDVESISNQFFRLNSNNKGQYKNSTSNVANSPSDGVYNWDLINYLGSDTTIQQTLVPRLTILNPLKTDTVSKSGFTLNYIGSSNASMANFILYQAYAINEEMGINNSSDPNLETIRINFSDNGSLKIDSEKLTSIIPNRYYQYNVSHFKYDTTYYKGKMGVLHSSTSVSQYVFITD